MIAAGKFPLEKGTGLLTQSGQETLSSNVLEVEIKIGCEVETVHCAVGHGIIVAPGPGIDSFTVEQAFGKQWFRR